MAAPNKNARVIRTFAEARQVMTQRREENQKQRRPTFTANNKKRKEESNRNTQCLRMKRDNLVQSIPQTDELSDSSTSNPFASDSDWSSFEMTDEDDPSYLPPKNLCNESNTGTACEGTDACRPTCDSTTTEISTGLASLVQGDASASTSQYVVPGTDDEDDDDDADSVTIPILPNIRQFAESEITSSAPGGSLDPVISVDKRKTKNKWDKKHSCKFCKKLVTKMSSHLQRCHSNETEVAEVLAMHKGSQERWHAWLKLLNEGDYQHNYEALESGVGILIPKYRSGDKTVENSVVCSHCKGLYKKSLLYLHIQRCSMRESTVKPGKGTPVRDGRLLMPMPNHISEAFYIKIIQKMRQDDISRLVQNDSLIILYGERMFYRKDIEEHTGNQVSSRLRELARLLQCLRRESEMKVSTLTHALHPSNFDLLLRCVREVAGFDEETHQFRTGSTALRLGYSLKKCTAILKAEALKKDDQDLFRVAESFDKLFSGDWYDHVSATASQSVHNAKAKKPRLLPACRDIEKINIKLEEGMKSRDYPTLAKATLCAISLFNRKRGGEVQRLKLSDYDHGLTQEGSTADPETLSGLSEAERKMVTLFKRIEIRGKFNRRVPILLTESMVLSLEKLRAMRKSMNPDITSSYFFVTQTGQRPYRGSHVIKQFAQEAEVSDMSVFTFTNLRKQVATLSQTLEITKLDQDQLATFLGHDIRVHRNIYRLPVDIIEKAKVAKILLAANRGVSLPLDKVEDINDGEEIEQDVEHGESMGDGDDDDEEGSSDGEILEDNEPSPASSTLTQTTKHCSHESSARSSEVQQNTLRPKRRQSVHVKWSVEEVDAVKRQLSHCFVSNTIPRKDQAQKAIASEPALGKRTWTNVKDFVYNLVKKQRMQ